ncbi:rhodanese-like domain-containing protein [Cocleimonas flava]|uniref:Rhodanese-related sulfurtransferase n=1 Tax=Cocleimonas flava TaxID=634765 RepID=A0A4R1EZH3_9GAMM|nr:rhodanese-like domain-containing protein [Cocleimonas flava]TCJ84658.1 rhodanese-related sulfurtransferase [Cocleimonas flava]
MALTFKQLVDDALTAHIEEIFPWDVEEFRAKNPDTLMLDIREDDEFDGCYIENSLHVPRGILEQACDWDYAETEPDLVKARKKPIIVVCRSGNRSILAALTMTLMGYENVVSLKTGIKGWNDADLPLINKANDVVDPDWVDEFVNPPIRKDQLAVNNAD